MSVIYFDGGETETAGTPESAFVRGVNACNFGATGQINVVRSGDVGFTMSAEETLLLNPKWSDTSEDYFDVHLKMAASSVDPDAADDDVDCVLFCTTPNPYVDGGAWFHVQLRCDAATNEITHIEIFKAINTDLNKGKPYIITPDLSVAVTSGAHWYVWRFFKDGGGSSPTCELFVDDISKGTVTGGFQGMANARIAFGGASQENAKGSAIAMSFDMDDFIILDEDSSGDFDARMVEAVATSGGIIGFQPDADVTGYNDYTVDHTPDPPSWSDKKYRNVDDQNRLGSPPTDDWIIPASPYKQLFKLPNSDVGATIHAVRLDVAPRVVDTIGTQFLAGVSSEGTGPKTITGWDDGVSGYVVAMLYNTPEDSTAWTKALFDDFYAGVTRSAASKHINAFGVQVLGIGLTTPTANPDSDNADVADPWAAAAEEAIPGPPVAAQII